MQAERGQEYGGMECVGERQTNRKCLRGPAVHFIRFPRQGRTASSTAATSTAATAASKSAAATGHWLTRRRLS